MEKKILISFAMSVEGLRRAQGLRCFFDAILQIFSGNRGARVIKYAFVFSEKRVKNCEVRSKGTKLISRVYISCALFARASGGTSSNVSREIVNGNFIAAKREQYSPTSLCSRSAHCALRSNAISSRPS